MHHSKDMESSPSSHHGADVPALAAAAERFLASQRWCARVLRVTPVFAVEGVLGVFGARSSRATRLRT